MKKNFYKERTCTKCGYHIRIELSKRDAAFDLVNIESEYGEICSQCNGRKFTGAQTMPHIDFGLLEEWATNLDLFLREQDEELILADEMYLEMILKVLDTMEIPQHKSNLLMDSLCIIVYDNTVEKNLKKDEKLKQRVITELNKRKEKLIQADDWIMDYIKQVVYPQLENK